MALPIPACATFVQSLLSSQDEFLDAGAFGDSGRLSKDQQKAMRQYLPKVELVTDDCGC